MAKRKRRSKADLLGSAVLRDVRAKRRTFLREVSELLSVALGFDVRVSLKRAAADLSPEERKASRRSAKANRRQIVESAGFGLRHPRVPFDDSYPDYRPGELPDEEPA